MNRDELLSKVQLVWNKIQKLKKHPVVRVLRGIYTAWKFVKVSMSIYELVRFILNSILKF